jgi:UDP-glucuronate decarboxylase
MSSLKNQIVLVTGGAGFIGSHLCEGLLNAGNDVICLDNFFTGNGRNIAHLKKEPNFKMVESDVEEKYDYQVDQIYNLACPAAPVWYQKDPVKTVRTNVTGAINALELAKKRNCRVLQASTSEVYGNPEVHPQTEDYWGNVNPIGPRACYDEGKRCAETLFFDYKREYGVDIRVARIFNTYGPRMAIEDGRVVNNFIIQALRGEDLTVFGNGSQTRSFCYISDMVRGLIALMAKNVTNPVNLGNPNETTVKEIAEKIISLTGSKSKIVYRPLPIDDPVKRKPDITRAREELGWEPSVTLEEGLIKTIKYFQMII